MKSYFLGSADAVLLLLSLLVSPAYVSKSKNLAVCAEPVCPFCHMAAAVDTIDAAVPQFLDGPSAASAPATAAAAAVRSCCCGAALTLSCTYVHALCLLLCSAMPYYGIAILLSTVAFSGHCFWYPDVGHRS